ncbi:MAG: DUF11 domain-containing protein [Phycisphaeraceae bacterium]|nr:DUF11 domain-containing protein [Phycisphaeraceae bacterium]
MNWKKWLSVGTAACLLTAGMALTGCETWDKGGTADDGAAETMVRRPTEAPASPKASGPAADSSHGRAGTMVQRPTEAEAPPPPAPKKVERKAEPAPAPRPSVNCATLAYPTGNRETSALWVEKCAPSQVVAGQEFDYTIRVTNLTNMTLSEVRVVEQMPAGFKVSKATPEMGGRDGWTFDKLAPHETKTITVTGSAAAQGTLENCISVTYNLSACLAVNVVSPALKLTKTAPENVLLCENIPVKLAVTNTGTGTARNVKIVDTLPDGLVAGDRSGEVVINVGDVAAGQTREYTATLRPTKRGKFTNNAKATGDNGLTADASATTTVTEPVLTITKTGAKKEFIGRAVQYTITVKNTGDAPAKNLTIKDTGNGTASAASDGGRIDATGVTWSLGTLEAGQSKTVTVSRTGNAMGTIKDTATASATCAQAVTASAETEIVGIPAILLEVVDTDPVKVGGTTTYTITVTNQGSADGTNIVITSSLEDSMEYVSSDGPTKGTVAGKTITFAAIPKLAPREKATFNVVVKAIKAGDVRFKTTMKSDQLSRDVEETEATNFYE